MAESDSQTSVTPAFHAASNDSTAAHSPFRSAPASALSTTAELCGIRYSRDSLGQFYATICRWLSSPDRKRGLAIGYVNPYVFNLAQKNPKLRLFLREADIVAVDGLGVALSIRLLQGYRQTRTVMTPLFDKVLASTGIPPLKALLIGGSQEVADKGMAAMNAAAGRMEIIKAFHGYYPLEDYPVFIGDNAGADLVLVAMGSPRSEELILAARRQFPGKTFWNIGGGTLHFYAGTQPRVPEIVSKLGLQWLWRIVHDPAITPRYVIGIPVFAGHVLKYMLSKKKN
jgi:N-acetylglucosaminyldiphosphoundecaprenol N-acetyl-beta-D-mannosaminyltransferase